MLVGNRAIGKRTAAIFGAIIIGSFLFAVPASSQDAPSVDLSPSNPDAVKIGKNEWEIPIKQGGVTQPGFCRGTFLTPEIAGPPSSVHYGIKYFCSEPVAYTITARALAHGAPAGEVHGDGVAQAPYLDGYSFLCEGDAPTGWNTYQESNVDDMPSSGVGNEVSLPCGMP